MGNLRPHAEAPTGPDRTRKADREKFSATTSER
jgi:hypothetical protein